jgi:hypothetical protein
VKRWLYRSGTVLLLIILAAIVFNTARTLINSAKQPGVAGQNQSLPLIKATELPQGDPDVVGLFVRRQDNRLFVGTGQVIFDRKRDPKTGSPSFSSAYAGPVAEILVTHATQIYYDVTPLPESYNPTSQIQQVVLAGSLDRLVEPAVISVWGSKSSGRWLASTLLILPPPG